MTSLPVEVELAFEVMPCNAMRTAQEPAGTPHACTYFRRWGTYHGYDYDVDGPPPEPGIVHASRYVGRVHPVPEMLSGCRKAPLMAIGINPNLPGWWPQRQHSLTPLFDDYRQYAHYFRYRSVSKLELPRDQYLALGGSEGDGPFSDTVLESGEVPVQLAPQRMYRVYQGLLDALAKRMGWAGHNLSVGEDLSYGNMVACASAKWTTRPDPDDPRLPPMSEAERDGIVNECFKERKHLPRQLLQSLPAVILILGQSTANAFIAEFGDRFGVGAPEPSEPVAELVRREIRLRYGTLDTGSEVDARVIFAPHATGNPEDFAPTRDLIVEQLAAEAQAGGVRFRPDTGHLIRAGGACVFCPMLGVGECDYTDELVALSPAPGLAADAPVALASDKALRDKWMRDTMAAAPPVETGWADTDETSQG